MSGKEIRNKWLKFFENKGHLIEKSASLIPYEDPSLLWINSGVAALKKYMDGREVPPSRRIVNVQKSIRTNDIDNVGYTARHLTFFEMLGCFSIGDYFKKEIIAWAKEILTSKDYFDLDIDKIYITYNPLDEECKKLWIQNGIDESHLIPLESNYWEIGEGPAGPNTEVFFDRGEKYDKDKKGVDLLKEEIENDRYIEIWGIVFSEFNAKEGKSKEEYEPLPSKNIDTGAGLERIVSIIQGTETNFETDLFLPIINEVEKISNTKYNEENATSFRVIADHIRAISFATSDGEYFSNEGRGYVLRRLLRRAMRYGGNLGLNKPFLHLIFEKVVEIYADFYPELTSKKEQIKTMIFEEEKKFIKTLHQGETLIKELINKGKGISAEDAFKLYDTYGFPFELTKAIAAKEGISIDEEGYKKLMEKQKENAREARDNISSLANQSLDLMTFNKKSEFVYDKLTLKGKVIAIFKDGKIVSSLKEGEEGDVIFDKTPFYATSGGQEHDIGVMFTPFIKLDVLDVNKAPNKQHLHHVKVIDGSLKVNDELSLSVNKDNRNLTMRNHSATHLLQSALINVLGDHIKQMGSYVGSSYLRFDFSHFKKISFEELRQIEGLVNGWIKDALPIKIEVMKKEEAIKGGAKSFFFEKYEDEVRVVKMGKVSLELCGGTHLKSTDEIGIFKIILEESISSGVRRILAKTSLEAYNHLLDEEDILLEGAKELNCTSKSEIIDRLKAFKKEKEDLKKERGTILDRYAYILSKDISSKIITHNDKHFLMEYLDTEKRETLLKINDNLKTMFKNYLFVFIGSPNDHYPILVTTDLPNVSADQVIKEVVNVLGGKGSGKERFAQGSLSGVASLETAKKTVLNLI